MRYCRIDVDASLPGRPRFAACCVPPHVVRHRQSLWAIELPWKASQVLESPFVSCVAVADLLLLLLLLLFLLLLLLVLLLFLVLVLMVLLMLLPLLLVFLLLLLLMLLSLLPEHLASSKSP
ncbi:hypothetical protein ACCQ05_18660 [Xanthomonas sp. NCPPB 3582]|uniref:hypothetical protein n=1 Tax=Xanthomonas sp. NCPPB 3582 TaxID=487557 RepID=UPI0035566AEE